MAAGILAAGTASAQPGLLTRPDPPGVTTVVEIRAFVSDVIAIRDAEQEFETDVYFAAVWRDARLAGEGSRTFSLDEVWHPGVQIANERDLRALLPRVVTVGPEGEARFVQRVLGTMSARMDLRDFPEDRQTFPIRIVSIGHTPEEVELRPAGGRTSGLAGFSAPGWKLDLGEAIAQPLELPDLGVQRPLLEFRIHGRRDVAFYRWTFFLPLALIVLMAWLVFWIDPTVLPPQVGLATGAVFSLIAFRFSIRLSLPPVSYMTRLDTYLLGCTALVFLALGQAVATGRLAKQGREDQARALDAGGRWIYLAIFAALTAVFV